MISCRFLQFFLYKEEAAHYISPDLLCIIDCIEINIFLQRLVLKLWAALFRWADLSNYKSRSAHRSCLETLSQIPQWIVIPFQVMVSRTGELDTQLKEGPQKIQTPTKLKIPITLLRARSSKTIKSQRFIINLANLLLSGFFHCWCPSHFRRAENRQSIKICKPGTSYNS